MIESFEDCCDGSLKLDNYRVDIREFLTWSILTPLLSCGDDPLTGTEAQQDAALMFKIISVTRKECATGPTSTVHIP